MRMHSFNACCNQKTGFPLFSFFTAAKKKRRREDPWTDPNFVFANQQFEADFASQADNYETHFGGSDLFPHPPQRLGKKSKSYLYPNNG
jgi:hypothetical protein